MVEPYLLRAGEGPALWFLGNLVTLKAVGAATHGQLTVAEFVNPAGFAPPLHRHRHEDELFYLLEGSARFDCGELSMRAHAGDFVLLPAGGAHSFVVDLSGPLRPLQITTPAGFEDFAADAGRPAAQRRLPDPEPIDPVALGHAAARHGIEILGPPSR